MNQLTPQLVPGTDHSPHLGGHLTHTAFFTWLSLSLEDAARRWYLCADLSGSPPTAS